ncbi:MAG: nucleotidyltransferase domain-containing protein [Bacteroidaceae bacterium]|nr:nucleotidyltransferase domain-containing protein [Bacteroidaceae bacterium]
MTRLPSGVVFRTTDLIWFSIILFGSRARGEAKKGSDWDILIVLPKDRLLQSDYDDVSYPLVKLGWDLNEPAIIKCYLCPPATMRAFYC